MKFVLFSCVAAFAVSGCAGLIAPFVNNPYAGNYDGTFTASDGREGTASIQMTKLGNVFGTLKDTKSGDAGSLTGSVDTHLSYSGTVSFPNSSHNISGSLNSSSGKISGTLKGSDGYTMTIDIDSKS